LRSRPRLFQSAREIVPKFAEVALDAARAPDHDVIRSGMTARRNDFSRKLAKAALHAIAHDRAADLLADGEPDALERIAVLTVADEEDEGRSRRAPSGVRSEEIRALAENI